MWVRPPGYLHSMRRGSSTVVALIGKLETGVLPAVGRSLNVATVEDEEGGLEGGILALKKAEGLTSPYVVVRADPLQELAAQWRTMWDVERRAQHSFEQAATEALTAWRAGRFELPDYYLVVTGEALAGSPHREDFHLGFLKSQRAGRVAAVVSAREPREEAARVLAALSALSQAPWWPPFDRLVEEAGSFFPGRLTAQSS